MKRFPPPFYNRRAMEAYVAHTHREWFDFLSTHARDGRLPAGPLTANCRRVIATPC